jgi:hypothetical protein
MTKTTAIDFDDFEELLDRVLERAEDLNETEYEFVSGLEERYGNYGDRTFVTHEQYDWLKRLAEDED